MTRSKTANTATRTVRLTREELLAVSAHLAYAVNEGRRDSAYVALLINAEEKVRRALASFPKEER
jgi:hypothetical protein